MKFFKLKKNTFVALFYKSNFLNSWNLYKHSAFSLIMLKFIQIFKHQNPLCTDNVELNS